MKVVVIRKWRREEYTIGEMYIDGKFFCHVCEDTDRNLHDFMDVSVIASVKVYARTAIPCGRYEVVTDYSNKYKRNMPHICNVKGFEGIRIHSGNSSKDSEGCLLLGKAVLGKDGAPTKDWVGSSRDTVASFETFLRMAGGRCEIEIR